MQDDGKAKNKLIYNEEWHLLNQLKIWMKLWIKVKLGNAKPEIKYNVLKHSISILKYSVWTKVHIFRYKLIQKESHINCVVH